MKKNRFLRLAKFIESRITKRQLVVLSVSFCVLLFSVLLCIFFLRKLPRPFNDRLTKTPPDSNYLYQNIDNRFQVYLGSKEERNKPMARFAIGPDKLVEFEAENMDTKEAKLEKGKILRYEQDKYDITYQIIEKGLKEELILKKKSEQPQFSFIISYPKEMEIKETLPNQLTFYEKDGGYLFHFAKPFMEDKNGQKSENIKIKAQRVKEPGCAERLGSENCDWLKYHLTFIPDQNWLSAEGRQYPVVLDPTIIHDTPSEFAEGTMNRIADSGSSQTPKIELPYHELPADINTSGLWHMNETADNSCTGGEDACDSSGEGNHGTANGTNIVDGKFGKARYFGGSISLGSTNLDFNEEGTTIELWVTTDDLSGNNYLIRSYDGGSLDNDEILFGDVTSWSGSDNLTLYITGGTVDSGVTFATGTWYHIALTWNRSSSKIYINGQQAGPTGGGHTVGDIDESLLSIGTAWNGIIDEVRVSKRILSPEEIAANASRRPYGVYTSKVIDFGQTPQSLNSLTWIDNVTPPTTPSGWSEVKPVLIDNTQNSSGLSNYQTKVHVDYDSNMQSDFDDLKFTNAAGTNLDYWIEEKSDGIEADVWVEVDTILANDWTAIFMFYGNGGASTASNGDNTFDFFDDFTGENGSGLDGSKWTSDAVNTVTASIQNNKYRITDGTKSGSTYWIYNDTDTGSQDQAIFTLLSSFAVEWESTAADTVASYMGQGGIALVDSSNLIESYLAHHDGSSGSIDFLRNWIYDTAGDSESASSGETKTFTTIRDDSTIKFYINNVWKETGTMTGTPSKIAIAVGAYGGYSYLDYVDLDNLRVRKYTSPEPTVAIGANIEFQTRTSADSSTWEAWKTTTGEAQIEDFDDNEEETRVYDVALENIGFNQNWVKMDNTAPGTCDSGGPCSYDGGRLGLGTTGKGDEIHAYYPAVVKDGSTYKMWYAGYDGNNYRIYYATSSDGLTWTKQDNSTPGTCDSGGACPYGGGRLGIGTSGKGDDDGVFAPTVIKDGSTYKMWYAGYDGNNYRIYYATSSDGLTWTKYDNSTPSNSNTSSTNGRIPLGSSGGDTSRVSDPTVIKDGSTYKMWYAGYDGTNYRIYYATSSDGLTWTKKNNTAPGTCDSGEECDGDGRVGLGTSGKGDGGVNAQVIAPTVIKDGSIYKMWYSGSDTAYRIYYATSSDGLIWTKYDNTAPSNSDNSSTNGRVPLGTSGKGDDAYAYYGRVIKDGLIYKMWYGGYKSGDAARIYYASMAPLPTSQSDESTIKQEGSGSLKVAIGPPQVDGGVVGLWHLEETSGTGAYIQDESPEGNDGTPSGNAFGGVDGKFGKAWQFDGTTDYIEVADDASLDITDDITMEVWAKFDVMNQDLVVHKSSAYGIWYDWSGSALDNNEIQFMFYGDGAWRVCDSDYTPTTGQWYYFAATYDKDAPACKFYVNGELKNTHTDYNQSIANGTVFRIGGWDSGTRFDGTLDEVRVSKVVRTADEIAEAYRSGRDHRFERTVSSQDLSDDGKLTYYIAADEPGTYLESYVSEASYSASLVDNDTVGLWHLEEHDEAWGDTFGGTTIDTVKWTEIDPNNNKISQNNGLVLSAGVLASWDSALISNQTFSRKEGNRIYASFTTSTSVAVPNHMMIGWGQDQTASASYANITHALYFNAGDFYTYQDGVSGGDTGYNYATSTTYEVLLDLGSDGKCRYYVKGGAFTNWTLLATDGTAKSNSPLRVHMAQYRHTGTFNEITAYPSVAAKDSSSVGNDGLTYGSTSTQGKVGKGGSFDGSQSHINIGDQSSLEGMSAITVEAWIKRTSDSGGSEAVVDKYWDGTDRGYRLYILNSDQINFLLATDSQNDNDAATSTTTIDTNQWYHVAGVWDNSDDTIRIYVNGEEEDTQAQAGNTVRTNSSPFWIGRSYYNDSPRVEFPGVIDEVRISKTARSATEIRQAYQQGLRTHQVTVDFVSSPQATYTSGTSITINNPWGTTNLTDTLSVGDTIIVKENENGTEYIAQAEVTAIANTSTTYGTVTIDAQFSSIPPTNGYTTNATVFKWQREYWDLSDISEGDRNGTTKTGLRVLDGSKGFTFYIDDLNSNTNYLYLPFGNTISSTAQRYFQYRAIVTGDGSSHSAPNPENNLTPQIDRVTINYTMEDKEKDNRPVAYWKLDEGYGTTAYDETINSHDGVLNNMESTDWVDGYEGKALDFGGTNEYISIANSADANFGDHDMSISTFVNTSSSGATYTIIDKYSSSKGYKLQLNSTGKVVFQVGDGTNTPSVTGNKTVNDGLWHSILAVRDKGSTLKIYVDGLYDNSASDTANNIDSTVDVVIGRDSSGSNYYIGKLDELELYDYRLSVPQSKVVYNKGFSAVLGADKTAGGNDPVGFWKFDEASGTSANDSSGQGNTGTLGAGDSAPGWITQGSIGNALDFDGSNDYVDAGSSSDFKFDLADPFTISAWINPALDSSDDVIVGNAWDEPGYHLRVDSSNKLKFIVIQSGSIYKYSDSSTLTPGWHHVVGVWDGTNVSTYVDGKDDTSRSSAGTLTDITATNNLLIGNAIADQNKYFNGQIDHVKIYDYARTVAQIHHDMAGSPVAYWKLDEGYGTTAYDETTNDNDGSLGAGASAPSWINSGKFGNALDFDGTDDLVTLTSTFGLTNAVTLAGWVKTTDTEDNNIMGENQAAGVSFRFLNFSTVRWQVVAGSNVTSDAGISIRDGKWHHIAGTYDGSTQSQKIYVDGVLKDSDSNSGNIQNLSTFTIGGISGIGQFDGSIDEVKIYNYALTADEVKVEYNQSSAVRLGNVVDINDGGGDPKAFWKFDEASGTSANDSSGQGNTGTLGTGDSAPGWETNGKIGTALNFDGSNDYVDITLFTNTYSQGSVQAWVRVDDYTGDWRTIFSQASTADSSKYAIFDIELTNGHPYMIIKDTAFTNSIKGGTVLNTGEWYHLVFQSTGTAYEIYVNGVKETLTVVGGSDDGKWFDDVTSSNNNAIGNLRRSSSDDLFDGTIDHVKIYDYARSTRQIKMDMDKGKPVDHWKLDEKSGSTAYDETNRDNDGTLQNMEEADHVIGKVGWALDFDGTSEYISLPSEFNFNQGTVTAWIKTTDSSGVIFAEGKSSASDPYYMLLLEYGKPGNYRNSSLGRCRIDPTVNDGNWHHIAWTQTGSASGLKIYVDGVEYGLTCYEGSNDGGWFDDCAGDNFAIAVLDRNLDYAYFDGIIDDVEVYNYALTAEEVKIDYNSGAAHFQ